ncbi:hypothetical protein DL96DRAFT_1573579 [Flagelloscypha sp. PMI_526]|nr:hypothetical protein DL96DRAFT_1573579 [Flagelloscypha sp. PMI_526]
MHPWLRISGQDFFNHTLTLPLRPSTRRASLFARYKDKPLPKNPDPFTEKIIDGVRPYLSDLASPEGRAARENGAQAFNEHAPRVLHAIRSLQAGPLQFNWAALKQNELISSPRHPFLHEYSNAIQEQYRNGQPDYWDPRMHDLLQDIAVHAAVYRCTNGLEVCLLWLIRTRNFTLVKELYGRFMHGLGENESWEDDEDDSSREDQGLAGMTLHTRQSSGFLVPGRVNILLALIAAHAGENDFAGAFRICLQTTTRFTPSFTTPFIRSLSYDQPFQARVSTFVERLVVARLLSFPSELQRLLQTLQKPGSDQALERLYQNVIQGMTGEDAYISASDSLSRTVTMPHEAWAFFLKAFIRAGRQDLAGKLWTDMNTFGIPRSATIWTAALEGYVETKRALEATTLVKVMEQQGVVFNHRAYMVAIGAYYQAKQRFEAWALFQKFLRQSNPRPNQQEVLDVTNTVIRGVLRMNQTKEAEDLLSSLRKSGPAPDTLTYNILLAHYARRQDFHALGRLVGEMASEDISWDVHTFSTILNALEAAGRPDATDMVIQMMRRQNVRPTTATVTAIIEQQLKEQKEANLQTAWKLFTMMEQDPELKPKESTYSVMLNGILRGHWLPRDVAIRYRGEILGRMRRDRIVRTNETYQGPAEAMSYLRQMEAGRLVISVQTWRVLLYGLENFKAWPEALEVVGKLEKSKKYMSPSLTLKVEKIKKHAEGQPAAYMAGHNVLELE